MTAVGTGAATAASGGGGSDFMDLLGLGSEGFNPAPPPSAGQPAPAAGQTPQRSAVIRVGASEAEPAITYPPSWSQTGEAQGGIRAAVLETDLLGTGEPPAIHSSRKATPVPLPVSAPPAPLAAAEAAPAATLAARQEKATPSLGPGEKHFVVLCEGRWRVRSAPSLNSKVLGTIANGTVVMAKEAITEGFEGGSGTTSLVASTVAALGLAGAAVASSISQNNMDKEICNIDTLWVQVVRLEAREPNGVSEIKKDSASGGILYCLRRNALGYGLYETGVESLEGPLLMLQQHLAMELRADAQRATSDKSEDLSLTWKLLGAAESFGKLFSSMSSLVDEGGVSEDIPLDGRQSEDLFEVKQRENLKRAAASLRRIVQKISSKAADALPQEDLTASLPKDVGRRFAKIRSSLHAAGVVTGHVAAQNSTLGSLPVGTATSVANDDVAEGNLADLDRFGDLCLRLERTGGWPELGSDLRQEIINFNQKHCTLLEEFARNISKASRCAASPSTSRNTAASPSTTSDLGSPKTPDLLNLADLSPPPHSAKAATPGSSRGVSSPFAGLALLPPPPAPSSSLARKP